MIESLNSTRNGTGKLNSFLWIRRRGIRIKVTLNRLMLEEKTPKSGALAVGIPRISWKTGAVCG